MMLVKFYYRTSGSGPAPGSRPARRELELWGAGVLDRVGLNPRRCTTSIQWHPFCDCLAARMRRKLEISHSCTFNATIQSFASTLRHLGRARELQHSARDAELWCVCDIYCVAYVAVMHAMETQAL